MKPSTRAKRPRPQRPQGDPAIDALGRAIATALRDGAGDEAGNRDFVESVPSWLDYLLGALAPLKALAPVHGVFPKSSIEQLAGIHRSLERVDLADAAPPPPDVDYRRNTKGGIAS